MLTSWQRPPHLLLSICSNLLPLSLQRSQILLLLIRLRPLLLLTHQSPPRLFLSIHPTSLLPLALPMTIQASPPFPSPPLQRLLSPFRSQIHSHSKPRLLSKCPLPNHYPFCLRASLIELGLLLLSSEILQNVADAQAL